MRYAAVLKGVFYSVIQKTLGSAISARYRLRQGGYIYSVCLHFINLDDKVDVYIKYFTVVIRLLNRFLNLSLKA